MNARILVVDDHPMNRKLAAALLESEGHSVVCVRDAAAALLAIGDTRPDLIVMDLQLPAIDGLTLTRMLRCHPATHRIPIVAVSALAMRSDERLARAAGCDDFIPKPIDAATFAALVGRHLPAPPLPPALP
jgi:CheY-like chemotaxis protein